MWQWLCPSPPAPALREDTGDQGPYPDPCRLLWAGWLFPARTLDLQDLHDFVHVILQFLQPINRECKSYFLISPLPSPALVTRVAPTGTASHFPHSITRRYPVPHCHMCVNLDLLDMDDIFSISHRT